MRREAAEEKARKEREREEHMNQFSGKSAISSSDYFGDASPGGAAQRERAARDYSDKVLVVVVVVTVVTARDYSDKVLVVVTLPLE